MCNRKDGQTHTMQHTEQFFLRYVLHTNRKKGPDQLPVIGHQQSVNFQMNNYSTFFASLIVFLSSRLTINSYSKVASDIFIICTLHTLYILFSALLGCGM